MKTRKQFFGLIAMAIIATAIIALPLAGCKDEPVVEQPQKQPDTPRGLSFGGSVTIKSDDQFTAAEWKTLCDKVVAAIERGYTILGGLQTNFETYLKSNDVSIVLLKSTTYDVEVKSSDPKKMFFKAEASVIDGITPQNLQPVIFALIGGNSAHYPN